MFHAIKVKFRNSDFARLYNTRDDRSKGRLILLFNSITLNLANVFVTGAFYTSFLAQNGIDIVKVGIISFIPYLCWIFSLFSPKILHRFKSRRGLMLFNDLFFYICTVLGTTVMPRFVQDPGARTVWFAVFLFLAHTSNALVGSGYTAWHLHFLPDGQDRQRYFSYMNLASSLMGTLTAIGSSVIADRISGTPSEATFLFYLRLIAFAVHLVRVLVMVLIPKEYPYEKRAQKARLRDVFVVPFTHAAFLLTTLVGFFWNLSLNTVMNTWTYYLMNTVKIPYLWTYIGSVVTVVGTILMQRWWRHQIDRHSWNKMLLVVIFISGLLQFPCFFISAQTKWLFVLICVLQGLNNVGVNLVFANLFYVNLPEGTTDEAIIFYNFSCNIGVLLSGIFGTWFLSRVTGSFTLFGLPIYGPQILVMIQGALLMLLSLYVKLVTPIITPKKPVTPAKEPIHIHRKVKIRRLSA